MKPKRIFGLENRVPSYRKKGYGSHQQKKEIMQIKI